MSDTTPELFITKIKIDKVRNIKDFEIPLSETERKHLILTGKNGSGKTSLLLSLNDFFLGVKEHGYKQYLEWEEELSQLQKRLVQAEKEKKKTPRWVKSKIQDMKYMLANFQNTSIIFSTIEQFQESSHTRKRHNQNNVPMFFLGSKRKSSFTKPNEIKSVDFEHISDSDLSNKFIQHIIDLRAQRAFAREDEDQEDFEKLDKWFTKFESGLQHIFDNPSFKLTFDRKNLDFKIHLDDQEPFTFSELSDGYSAILNIVTELIMRMEARDATSHDVEGVILIDEIENHLHVDLQKKILPFLCNFFPKIQFIVSTHSPFVISSVSNAVICDLEKRIVTSDLSGYSYSTLVESYFGLDQYSAEVKEKLADYKRLSKSRPTDEDKDYYFELKHYFEALPKYLAPELQMELKSIQLSMLPKKD